MPTTNNKHISDRLDKIESELSQLVGIIAKESADRRVFEERMTNALSTLAEVAQKTVQLQTKMHDMELYLARNVATVNDRKKIHERIDAIENGQKLNTWVVGGAKHFFWLVVAMFLGFIGYKMKGQ